MLKETRKFHQKTKLSKMQKDPEGPIPISHIHVFHKEYPRFKKVDLPPIDYSDSEFETALNYRESTRSFSDNPLKLEHLSKVLQTCRIVDPNRNPERRTYPSGGARFPVELYVICYNVENLPKGAYHYSIVNRNLEVLLEKDLNAIRRELISEYLDNPAASIFLQLYCQGPRSNMAIKDTHILSLKQDISGKICKLLVLN